MALVAGHRHRRADGVRAAQVGQGAQRGRGDAFQRQIALRLVDQAAQRGRQLRRRAVVARLADQRGRQLAHRRRFVLPRDGLEQHRPRPRVLAARQADQRRAPDLVDVARHRAQHEIARARRAQVAEGLQLRAPDERPWFLLGARDQRRRRLRVVVLAERERRRLAHPRIRIAERAAQRGPNVDAGAGADAGADAGAGAGGGRQARELARRQVAQHGLVSVLAQLRQRAGIARAAQSPERHHRAATHLEAAFRRERRAQRSHRLGAPLRIAPDHSRQRAQQVGLPRAAVMRTRRDRGEHSGAGQLRRLCDRADHRRAHGNRSAPQRVDQHLRRPHVVDGAQHARRPRPIVDGRLVRREQRRQRRDGRGRRTRERAGDQPLLLVARTRHRGRQRLEHEGTLGRGLERRQPLDQALARVALRAQHRLRGGQHAGRAEADQQRQPRGAVGRRREIGDEAFRTVGAVELGEHREIADRRGAEALGRRRVLAERHLCHHDRRARRRHRLGQRHPERIAPVRRVGGRVDRDLDVEALLAGGAERDLELADSVLAAERLQAGAVAREDAQAPHGVAAGGRPRGDKLAAPVAARALGPGGGDVAVVQLDGRAQRAGVAARRARARRRDPVKPAQGAAGGHRGITPARDQLLDARFGQGRHDGAETAAVEVVGAREQVRRRSVAAGDARRGLELEHTIAVDPDAGRSFAVDVARTRQPRPQRLRRPATDLADPDLLGGRAPHGNAQLRDAVAVDDRVAQPGLAPAQRRGLHRDVRDRGVPILDVEAAVRCGRQRQRLAGEAGGRKRQHGGQRQQGAHAAGYYDTRVI
jgi:hypothetical protein